ncbi:methyltransferase, TIGR00027 family [Novosphingobium sp. CF614]|uniref:class I SAM-dependent methyltransferase n=1 Tax=Novosphingobium sp. CF614 TaxID=1884364 RepID=UPI0008F1B996|nr:class I SAM-dependent methyltransferase [Novosphingobium sp. CF614]SFF77449.1 methyltransferase, TIGR00027 family [Novosphingobium sp. CF614]
MASAQKIELSGVHQTALASAALRGAHTLCGDEPKIFRDELALRLAGMPDADAVAMMGRVSPASASTCILRSRFTEDRLAAARDRVSQYVILGAGLDSFALRQGDGLGDLAVYEVEDPPFQEWKRQRTAELGLTAPAQLHYVPCDFEVTSLEDALAASDFDPNQPCFISWLGVTQYLTPDAVKGTLAWAAARPAGSEIVLTFLEENEQALHLQAGVMSGLGRLTYFSPAEMTGLLENAGFSRIEHLSADRANEIYFRDRKDGLIAPQIQRLVSAIV